MPGRVPTEKFSSSLGYLCKPTEISQCPQAVGAWLGSVWGPVWADGSAEVNCSPGFHGVTVNSVFGLCKEKMIYFPITQQKTEKIEINVLTCLIVF